MPAKARRILQIAHSHPRFHPGGTELTALALHHEACEEGLDSWYLGALDGTQITPNLGARTVALSHDHREAALFTDNFVRFGLEQPEYHGFLKEFTDYLETVRPDVIHFHHMLQFGLEAVHAARNALPKVKLILTAHDFYLICANNGQLYKYAAKERCPGPALNECPKCFANVSANDVVLRRQNIAMTVGLFDAIVAPSHFLKSKLETFLGVDRAIGFVENAYLGDGGETLSARPTSDDVIFGYFGNISAIKGLGDLLDAAEILKAKGREGFRIHVHGAQLFKDGALKERMDAAEASLGPAVRFFGGYGSRDAASLMADVDCMVFPSLWWENAPLVIYEALHRRRQVIAYPHGGAPEILGRYDVGLVARKSQPDALAEEMERVLDNPSLATCAPSRKIPGRKDLLAAYSELYFE